MKKYGFQIFTLGALVISALSSASTAWPIENIAPTAGPCGTYVTETITGETGCRDRGGLSACDDGSPWFYDKNYTITRQHLTKIYTSGTRHLCTAWTPSGPCCNTIAEPPCPDSTCHL
ncbi:MAG: hypothetical protein JST12_11610 [Armatimonadetes bacterium]|nr:hypothetical protein [Armatimonadota bacterium]